LLDGTSRHLVYFDELKRDAGYAGAIETTPSAMASSHQVKRFFARFSPHRIWLFRRLLQQLFLWRLHIENPDVIVLGVDTMVMDNSESDVRHGVEPTYKQSSSPGELHPQALTEPDVNLSIHPALIVQSQSIAIRLCFCHELLPKGDL